MRLLHCAEVYVEDEASGDYNIQDHSDLRCRSTHIGSNVPFEQRRDAGEMRHLIFDRNYEMPADCRIVINGTTYAPIEETFKTVVGTNGKIKLRAVDIVEIEA